MAITNEDLQPYLTNYLPSYYSGNTNSTGGYTGGGNGMSAADIASFGDPLMGLFTGGNFMGGLFGGGDQPQWKPYVQDGKNIWEDPTKRNPVPVADVPGASVNPSDVYKKAANNVQSMYDLMPYINQSVNSNIVPNAQAQLAASQATSGGYAKLMTDLYNQYGPGLNAIGNEISRRNALAQAGTDLEVLNGPGKDLVKGAYDLSQIYDKPYYDTRQITSDRMGDLLKSIDLSGGLSTTERDEISKGLAYQNQQAGTAFSPSQTNTVSNAMQYGKAGKARQDLAKGQLASAIAASSAFLPAAKSGVDVFQVATGKSSTPNSGNNLFTGVNTNTSQGGNLAGSLSNQMFGANNSMQQTAMNIDANKKDWLDKMNQITSSMKDVGSMASSFMM